MAQEPILRHEQQAETFLIVQYDLNQWSAETPELIDLMPSAKVLAKKAMEM